MNYPKEEMLENTGIFDLYLFEAKFNVEFQSMIISNKCLIRFEIEASEETSASEKYEKSITIFPISLSPESLLRGRNF